MIIYLIIGGILLTGSFVFEHFGKKYHPELFEDTEE